MRAAAQFSSSVPRKFNTRRTRCHSVAAQTDHHGTRSHITLALVAVRRSILVLISTATHGELSEPSSEFFPSRQSQMRSQMCLVTGRLVIGVLVSKMSPNGTTSSPPSLGIRQSDPRSHGKQQFITSSKKMPCCCSLCGTLGTQHLVIV